MGRWQSWRVAAGKWASTRLLDDPLCIHPSIHLSIRVASNQHAASKRRVRAPMELVVSRGCPIWPAGRADAATAAAALPRDDGMDADGGDQQDAEGGEDAANTKAGGADFAAAMRAKMQHMRRRMGDTAAAKPPRCALPLVMAEADCAYMLLPCASRTGTACFCACVAAHLLLTCAL